jgi:hypothetical protein
METGLNSIIFPFGLGPTKWKKRGRDSDYSGLAKESSWESGSLMWK